MTTIHTTSKMDGLCLEHKSTGKITITAEVPTEVGIENLIKELLTFLPAGSSLGEKAHLFLAPPQSLHKPLSAVYQTPVPEVGPCGH